jgi:hypothetical protein
MAGYGYDPRFTGIYAQGAPLGYRPESGSTETYTRRLALGGNSTADKKTYTPTPAPEVDKRGLTDNEFAQRGNPIQDASFRYQQQQANLDSNRADIETQYAASDRQDKLADANVASTYDDMSYRRLALNRQSQQDDKDLFEQQQSWRDRQIAAQQRSNNPLYSTPRTMGLG